MGVADNKSYKDQYHFNSKFFRVDGEDFPSIGGDPKINSTIKENPYMSNVEIEGKEIVLQPDLSALFKAVGKRHSKGGMDVLLKPDSFIFSDDKTLSFDEQDHELFEFKKGGNFKPHNNTPSAVLKRNIDVKHYNTLVNNIDNVHKDDLAKKSSMKMLEKYIGMLGNIAYLQEEKKNFPQGLPSFSLGTAPVYDDDLKNKIMENKQYAKYGGKVDNPYMEEGGFNKCPCGTDSKGKCIPCTPQQLEEIYKKSPTGRLADVKGMNKIGAYDQYTDLYHTGTDPSGRIKQTPGPKMSNENWKAFLKTPQGRAWSAKNKAGQPGTDQFMKVRNFKPAEIERTTDIQPLSAKPPVFSNPTTDNIPVPATVLEDPQNPISADWQYTPEQKVSQLYSWLNFTNVKRYMPYRSHLKGEYIDPALLNEQQAVGNARSTMRQQLAANRSYNPIIANAQNNAASGSYLDKIPEIGLTVQNQNVGIRNRFKEYNNQTRMNVLKDNLTSDQRYYMESIEGRKNFDNARSFASNQAMNLRDRHTEQNQALAYNMLTVNNPSYIFDWRSGRFIPNPERSILNQQGATPQDSWERMLEYAKSLKSSGLEPAVQSALLRGQYFKQAAPYFQQSRIPPPFGKRGGRVGRK